MTTGRTSTASELRGGAAGAWSSGPFTATSTCAGAAKSTGMSDSPVKRSLDEVEGRGACRVVAAAVPAPDPGSNVTAEAASADILCTAMVVSSARRVCAAGPVTACRKSRTGWLRSVGITGSSTVVSPRSSAMPPNRARIVCSTPLPSTRQLISRFSTSRVSSSWEVTARHVIPWSPKRSATEATQQAPPRSASRAISLVESRRPVVLNCVVR